MAKTQNTGKDIEQEEFSLIAGGNAKKNDRALWITVC